MLVGHDSLIESRNIGLELGVRALFADALHVVRLEVSGRDDDLAAGFVESLVHDHLLEVVKIIAHQFLEFFRLYILPIWQDDQILLATGNEKRFAASDMTEIAGLEPAIRGKSLFGGDRVVVVTEHHIVATNLDFSIAFRIRLDDANLNTRNWNAHRTWHIEPRAVGGYQRRALGDAVAVVHSDSHIGHFFGHHRIERGRP